MTFFNTKITFALWKAYYSVHVLNKFTSVTLNVYTRDLKYIEKWFPFENSPCCALSVSSLADHERSPSFVEVIQIWMLSPWETELHSNHIYEEVGNMDMMFTSLEGTTCLDKSTYIFSAKNLQVQIC
jgi:hypothetical protein